MKNHYFTTGEFAKICSVSKQTLIYYDRVGIFSPDITGSNGYRYYSYTQIETFTVIAMLRDLGVHIREIKAHMDCRSPEALIRLMEVKSMEIEKKIQTLRQTRQYIDKKILITREGQKAVRDTIQIQDLPQRYMITSDYNGPDDTAAVTEALGDHLNYCSRMGLHNATPIGSLIPVESVSEDGYKYSKFYTAVESFPDEDELFCAQGGPHLTLYDDHGYENIGANCLRMMDYATSHNLKLGKIFYEDVILDDLSTEGYFNYLVRLSIPFSE